METVKLYEQDPCLREFTATVLSCEAAESAWQVTVDRTAFFPEGGGQPADRGTLGAAQVLDVHARGGVVFHTCDRPLEIGAKTLGEVDWDRRFDHMQQHSGEHILSGILCADYHCDNVGFHLGADAVTIDYNAVISWEQALEAERKANEIIWVNREVEIAYPTPETLAQMDYRSKKALTGQVRIVTFPGADCCACCGTHVTRAGQVGLVKVLSCQKFREGVRLEILCGRRALNYLSQVYDGARSAARRLSVKPQSIDGAVERLEMELSNLKERESCLEEQVFDAIAAENAGRGDVLLLQPSMGPDSVRRLADAVARRCGGLAAVFAGEQDRYTYALVRADGGDISSFVKELNRVLHGRGGGRKGFAQGSIQAKQSEITAFFAG